MTPERPRMFDRRIGRGRDLIDHVIWEPQLPRRRFRRGPWEQATIVETSVSGAVVQAHANRAIKQGTRISIALGDHRGLVAVRRVDPARNPLMSYYGVEFVRLDPELQERFDEAVSTATSGEVESRSDSATERPRRDDVISLRY